MDMLIRVLQALFGGNPIGQMFQDGIAALQPLLSLLFTTPLQFTTGNGIVFDLWQALVVVSDLFLGLLVTIGAIQMMYGQMTGSAYMPPSQFIARAILSVILIHISWLVGQDLILFNNELCQLFRANARDFLTQLNHGQMLGQGNLLSLQPSWPFLPALRSSAWCSRRSNASCSLICCSFSAVLHCSRPFSRRPPHGSRSGHGPL